MEMSISVIRPIFCLSDFCESYNYIFLCRDETINGTKNTAKSCNVRIFNEVNDRKLNSLSEMFAARNISYLFISYLFYLDYFENCIYVQQYLYKNEMLWRINIFLSCIIESRLFVYISLPGDYSKARRMDFRTDTVESRSRMEIHESTIILFIRFIYLRQCSFLRWTQSRETRLLYGHNKVQT